MIRPEDFEPVDPIVNDRVNALYQSGPFNRLLGFVSEETRKGYSRARLPWRDDLDNPLGIVHGGATASLIDIAMAGAVMSIMPDPDTPVVTVNMQVQYLEAARKEDLIAHAAVRRAGRSLIALEVDVYGAKSGKKTAHGELSYLVVNK